LLSQLGHQGPLTVVLTNGHALDHDDEDDDDDEDSDDHQD
jgi:hypothetical protein